MAGRWGEAPFAALSAALALGIGLAQLADRCWFAGAALACLATVAGATCSARAGRQALALWLALCAITQGGALLALARREGYPDRDVRALLSRGALPLNQPVGFDACVTEERSRDGNEIVLRMDLRALRVRQFWEPSRGGILIRIPADPNQDQIGQDRFPRYGDRIRGWGMFDLRRDFANPGSADRREALARRGVFLVGRVKSSLLLERVPGDCSGWWDTAAVAVRRRLETRLTQLAARGETREAAILASILVGNYSELDGATRDAFQNSGTFHVLVVSGLHVGWLAWALMQLLRLARCPDLPGRLAVAAAILFYTSVVGFQASISRSFWMFFLYVCGQALSRRSSPVNIAGASAFVLLAANPDWLFDAGFQLSFLSVLAICLLGAPVVDSVLRPVFDPLRRETAALGRRFGTTAADRLGRRCRVRVDMFAESCGEYVGPIFEGAFRAGTRWVAKGAFVLAGMLVISLSVQLWIEPVLACRYNRLSWIAPLANLAIVPLSSVVLAAGIAAALTTGIPHVSAPCLDLAALLASSLFRITQATAALPSGWQRCPTPAWGWAAATALLLAGWTVAGLRRVWFPCACSGALLLALAAGRAPSWLKPNDPATGQETLVPQGANTPVLTLTFLDVGQGDCTVVRFPGGRVWVVDAGGMRQEISPAGAGNVFDVGEAVVSRYLWHGWVCGLDRVLVTHPHQDHAGGVNALLRNFRVGGFEYGNPDPLLSRVLETASARGVPCRTARTGEVRRFGAAEVETLCPPPGQEAAAANESSIVLRITFGEFSALLTGDMEKSEEAYLVGRPLPIRSTLLKVAHHGSRYATLDPMLERIRPRWAVISAGRNNPFGVPSRDLLMRLLRRGARPLLTMDQGAISLATDGSSYVLRSHVAGLLEAGRLTR